MKSYSKTGVVLLLVMLLSACGILQAKKDEPAPALTPEQQQQAAIQAALLQQEYEQALTSMRQGNYPLAIKEIAAFSENHPEHAGPYVNLGILYHKMNRLEAAEQALSKAVSLNPNNAMAQNRLGMVYREMGRFNDARAAYDNAITADENYADAYLNLGILHDLYLLDGERALQLYSQYQKMTGERDAQVAMWIMELKQRNQQATHAGMVE